MQSGSTKITLKIKRDQDGTNGSTSPDLLENTNQVPEDRSSSEEENDKNTEDMENQTNDDAHKQLVVYDPSTNNEDQIESVPVLNDFLMVPIARKSFPFRSTKPLPSVGAFTVQCAKCRKWRLIPTKEKYEEIREHVLESPFYCETALEWRADISCENPSDISQDGSRLWAIDKPSIAKPPSGWQRLLRIRGEGSSKFADVYYVAPTGKRLRSMIEIQKYLQEHPEYGDAGVQMIQFSFRTPRPLPENYVRKRTAKLPPLVNPISWANPDENTDVQLGGSGLSKPFSESPSSEPITRPIKCAKKSANESTSNFIPYNDQQNVKIDEPSQPVKIEEPSQSINGEDDA